MISAGKGEPKTPESKSNIPTGQVGPVTARPVGMPNFQKPAMAQSQPGMAETLAMSGTGSPQRQFDPRMAQQMLNQRVV